ncbi:MAG: lytic transglycosylase domain-containing protein [Candidatus Kerfeldbacteria bacterium]
MRRAFAIVLLIILGSLCIESGAVRADTPSKELEAELKMRTCKANGYKDGAFVYDGKSGCAVDMKGEGGILEDCNSSVAICCYDDKKSPPVPVCHYLSGANVSSPLTDVSTTDDGTTKTKPPITFSPNVPIPGYFEETGYKTDDSLLVRYLSAFYIYFIGVIGILAVVMIMYGGYHYITALGNPQRMNKGKEIISSAIIGLILALTSFLLLRTINPALVNFYGVVPTYIARILQETEKLAKPERHANLSIDVSKTGMAEMLQRAKTAGYDATILQKAGGDKELAYHALATMFIESSVNPNAISSANAYGLMQVLPSTAQRYGVVLSSSLLDPNMNIHAGVSYLYDLKKGAACPPYNRSTTARKIFCQKPDPCTVTQWQYVHAAYNGGPGANYCSKEKSCLGYTWWQCSVNKGYAETRQYVYRAKAVYEWLVEQNVYP